MAAVWDSSSYSNLYDVKQLSPLVFLPLLRFWMPLSGVEQGASASLSSFVLLNMGGVEPHSELSLMSFRG